MTSFGAIEWAASRFPHQLSTDAMVVSGAFHDVVIERDVVARTAIGRGHRERSTREWKIAEQIGDLFTTLAVPRVLSPIESDAVRSGYLLTRLPDSEEPPSEWAQVRSTYEAILGQLSDTPVSVALPSARSWCGVDLLRIIDAELSPQLEADTDVALRAVETVQQLPRPTAVLVHGDFGPHNIIWRHGRAHALIDWDHACADDSAIDVAPLIGAYGSTKVRDIVDVDTLTRAMQHRATLSLQVAAAAHTIGRIALRDHALGNFRTRLHSGMLYDPDGAHP